MRLLAILLLLAFALPAHSAASGDWRFSVKLDGRAIGLHQYTIEPAGAGAVVRSEASFDVKILFVTAYRYDHEAVEQWQDGCLQSLSSRTDSNGTRSAVTATAGDGVLAVTRPSGRERHSGCVMSFAYWDPRILEADRLLNSQTGELVPVQVTDLGQESVAVRGALLAASRYRISGRELQIDVWYSEGRWIGLEALTEGGRRLRYELQ